MRFGLELPLEVCCSAGLQVCLLVQLPPKGAVLGLRILLMAIGIPNSRKYRPHDLRRGHAEDLRASGAPMWKILAAGEWSSSAFQVYMDMHRAEMDAVMQGFLNDESDDEDLPEEQEDASSDGEDPAPNPVWGAMGA